MSCPKNSKRIKEGFWSMLSFAVRSIRRHFPLFLAVAFLTPAAIFLGVFIYSRLNKPPTYAASFSGAVRVSKQSTTLSAADNTWYKAMAYSGDGVNGDAESGNLNPIHPGGTTDGSAGGLAVGYVSMGATTTYAASQFIGFKPDQTGNLAGVMLVIENLTATSLANSDVVVELLQFPSATCTTSCSNYVTGTQGAYTYPSDTVVLRRTVWQHNQGLSGENAQPGNHGRATFDFRFDPPVAVTAGGGAGNHYGIRIINMGASAPVFGTWAQAPQANGFPAINGTIRTIGVQDIDLASAPTFSLPVVLSGNNVLTTSPMVAVNSLAGVGMATVRRTENEHWTATYSSANSNWTIAGSVSGTQTNKLTTATDGGTGASWVNDGVTTTTLAANIETATTRFCVASITGFAANQYFDVWDANTSSAQFTIASVNASDASCPSSGPSIISTAATVVNTHNYTTNKNATIARATWKQRIVQGAITAFTANMPTTTKICVASGWAAKFSANTAGSTANNIAVWDNNSAIAANRVTSTTTSDAACGGTDSLTIATAITAGTYTTDQSAYVAELSANISNSGTPPDGAIARYTTFNHPQNPTGAATLLSRTTSVALAYAKMEAPATANTRYPFLSNRHIFFVAYGDADTSAPADGDIIMVGNGKSDPDSGDSSTLNDDLNWSSKQAHVVTIDRSWDAAMAYTGFNGSAINDGAGSRTNFSAWSQNGGWVSAVVSPGSQLGVANTANSHFRIILPGKIVVDSDASVAFGTSTSPIPSTSMHDIYFDNVGPTVSSLLTVDSAATATLTVASTTGFRPGDTIVLDDNDSAPTTRIIAAIENATTLTLTANAVVGYTVAQSAFVAKGPTTELPTGQDRMAGVYTMTGVVTSTQSNLRAGRVSLYASGSAQLRTSKSDLAVDIDGNIDTGFLGNNLTDAGNTWLDVEDDVVGNWQPLDQVAVGGGTNQAVDNNISSIRMGANDDANQMPVWTGLQTAGGRNALPAPNMEVAEIGTIPMTSIYNSDYNGGSPLYSSNYNNSASWTIFNDGANTEVNDAVYFGDSGSNMFYALEFNLGTAMVASANYVWEYYKSGVGWTAFTPRDAYTYQVRTGVTLPLSADTVRNSYTISLATGGTVFGPDQVVMIDDNDSDPIYRRLTAVAAGTLTFSEPVPAGYTTAQGATVTRLNGGQWKSMNPTSIFTNGTGRRMIAWTPSNLGGTAAKTTINSVNAYWVRARISSFTSWTTSPTNQTTPVGMSGIERVSSGAITVSSGSQEAKITEVTPGASYDPNENWMLEYGNSPGWVEVARQTTAGTVELPSAPYFWHIDSGTLNINQTNRAHLAIHNSQMGLSTTDYTVTGLVYMDQAADTNARKLGFLLRQNLDGNGYAVLINKTSSANTVWFYSTLAGVPTALTGTPYSKTFNVDTWYCLKAQVTSTTLNAKFWETADCASGEPGGWDTNTTNATYTAGRFGVYAGSGTNSVGMKAKFDTITTDTSFSDSFTSAGTWRVTGSTQGYIGAATPGTPFTSSYLNFILKHKGGKDGVTTPEIGDKIYLSSTGIRSYKGLDAATGITTSNTNTKYEVWDFEWNPSTSKYTATGSATGAAGSATPGTTFTSSNNEISLKIPSGTPTATKFGDRMLLLQGNLRRNNGSWTGINGFGSAALVYPTYTLTSSAIATRYNIEGQAGTATARQRGTIDFWFKTNYSGSPNAAFYPSGMYLIDYAANNDTDRIFIRHTPDGYLEAAVYAAAVQQTLLRQSFSATAGEWRHFRLGWDETETKRYAWLGGVPFASGAGGQGSTLGARGANAGLIRIGNRYLYDAPFDGSIDELAIFDDNIDTSSGCNWGTFDVPTSAWTGGETVGCTTGKEAGINLFRASFDTAMNPQEGFVWADYAFGNPAMVFTNGADTGNERIRVVTYPQRTRIWVDNSGEKYTPSARIKFGSGFQENATLATLAGWSHNFTYHHKAARQSASAPTYSPVLNLRRSTHIWSDEPITQAGATMGAPINAGMGFGMGTIGMSGLATIQVSDVSMENQYTNFAVLTNPYTSLTAKPSQRFSNCVFYNFYDRAYTVSGKTQGTNYVGAYFVTTHFAAANIGTGYNAGTSQNVGIDGSIFMGNRNAYATVPPAAANGAAAFYSGRLYTINNSEFYNNGATEVSATLPGGFSGALNFGAGVAKVTISNNIFSINTNGIRLFGNAFITMSNNVFDGHISDNVATVGGGYGSGIRSYQSYSSVAVTDTDSVFGRGMWNEADISLPPNTVTFEAESLLQFTGEGTQLRSPVLFGTVDYSNMNRIADEYLTKTIPGTDVRGIYSANKKDIVNLTTLGLMRTTGTGLTDTTVRTSGGYGWRLEPTDPDVNLDYKIKVVGVTDKPLAVTGYLRLNSNYGTTNLPTVTLSGLGMSGANLTWTAAATADTWQQFVVSGTPTESALAEVTISGRNDYIVAASGNSEIIANPIGNYLPVLLEDNEAAWITNQWVGYKLRDANGKVFEIVRNTDKLLYLKGQVVPHLLSTTFAATTTGDYIIYNEPYFYIDDVSVLSGTVDTGTLDFHSSGQPVSPWLSTGLTAEGVWNAQFSTFANSAGSFGQLLGDALVASYADVFDLSPTATEFDTNLSNPTDDFYNNGVIIFTEGANKGAVRRISDYVGLNKTITVDPALPSAPADGDRFAILAATSSSAGGSGGASAAEIWSYAIRRLTDENLDSGKLATAEDVANIRADIANVLTELGTGNISAIKTKTDTINWSNVTDLVTTSGEIKAKTDTILWSDVTGIVTAAGQIKAKTDTIDWTNVTGIKTKTDTINWSDVTGIVTSTGQIKDKTDTINWSDVTGIKTATDTINWLDISAIKTKTDTINWSDVTGIKLKTDTIIWGDITDIKSNVATLINEIGTGNIAAIKTSTDTIKWTDITGIVTTSGQIKAKTDTIDWTNVTAIKTKTDTIAWDDVTGIKAKTDTIAWGDIADIQTSVSSLNDISAADVWTYATRTITGEVALTADSRKAIWDTACAILNTSGSVGKQVCDNLDAAVSSRSTLTAAQVWAEATRTITGLENPALAAIANNVWSNASRTLTDYGNDITAQDVWDVLTSSLTTIDSIGKLLVTNVDETISSRASQVSLNAMAANVATIMSEIGAGNISAIKTKTDTINWDNVTGLVTTTGQIKSKTDTVNWSDISAVKTRTDTISWSDITGIKLKTDTIVWGDITNIKTNVATLITEIGTGNISAIKTKTDTINWSDVTGLITASGQIKAKTDTIDWANITAVKTKTDTISWSDVTGIKLKTDTIDWSDVTAISSRVDTTVSSRASQSSLDAHESAQAAFRTQTTNTLGAMTVNVAAILTQLSTIETKIDAISSVLSTIEGKIDTIDANLDSVKTTVEDTNTKVAAMQTVTNDILAKWGSYSAATIIGYIELWKRIWATRKTPLLRRLSLAS